MKNFRGPLITLIILLSPAIALAAPTAAELVHLGNVCVRQDKNREGIKDYSKAIKLDPTIADAYYNRGYAYLKIRKYRLALADFNKAISINPQYAAAYHLKGVTFFFRKRYTQAIDEYSKAIALDPDNLHYLVSRMSANFKLGYQDRVWKDVIRIQKLGGTVDPIIINMIKNKKYKEQ